MRGNLWSADAPDEDRPLDLVVYRSRLIGADPDLVVWGGGNTSVKTEEVDFRGRARPVLRIKGSGTDLKTIDHSGFPGIFLDDILPLLDRESMSDEEMVAYLEHCMLDPAGRRPSIETLLHGFLPARHVDHVHADAIVSLTNTERGLEAVREVFDDWAAAVPYRRPGFALAKEVYEASKNHEAVVLMNHGLVTWGDTAEQSYLTSIEMVEQAQSYLDSRSRTMAGVSRMNFLPAGPTPTTLPIETLLPRVRGRLGGGILRLDTGDEIRAIADRHDVQWLAAAGPATADHVLRIRTWTCVLDGDKPEARIDEYEARYREFFARHAEPGLAMLSPLPKVFLVPGVGMITAGKDAKDTQVTADVAFHTLRVATWGQDAHGPYRSLDEEDLFHVDYWPLELYKLTLAPPPAPFEGNVVLVTGAASGIGRAVARHLAALGAQLVLLDVNAAGLETTAQRIAEAGGPAPRCETLDLTDEAAVCGAIAGAVRTFGGVDGLVSNAGVPAAGFLADLSADAWRRSMDINATSHFLITREAMAAMRAQGLGGSIVFVASKNAFGPGAGFGAYSAAKAAQVQLMRITALEGGKDGIRANAVNPDAVFEDSGLWSDDVRRERAAAHGVPVEDLEAFYAQRNLLHTTIGGNDVAESVAFLLSDRARATTGTVIAVDGGVAAAFPR
jgi:rhamnulose-1-phosphate aldolase/alcohol dehydrogenase